MIARLSNGPAVNGNGPAVNDGTRNVPGDALDIHQATVREPERWLRMAPVGGNAGWARLELSAPPWPGEAVYELALSGAIGTLDGDEVYLYTHAPAFAPNRVWQGKGGAARQRVRIVELDRSGVVLFERIAGADIAALRKPGRVDREQLEAAFEPTEDFDDGAATVHPIRGRMPAATGEDVYTNTPEDAAEFERRRAEDAGELERYRPDPSEL